MKKEEYIAKYGEDVYKRHLEQCLAWNRKHRENLKVADKKYRDTHPEKVKAKNTYGSCIYDNDGNTEPIGYVDQELPEGEAFHEGEDDDGLNAFRKSWEADEGGLIANHPDKPCRAMRTRKHLVGDLPRYSPKGKCYYDYQKDCNAWCKCWEGDEDNEEVKKIREVQDNIKNCGLPKYNGLALVEKDPHQYGIIDVIQILDGEITLLTEEEIKNFIP